MATSIPFTRIALTAILQSLEQSRALVASATHVAKNEAAFTQDPTLLGPLALLTDHLDTMITAVFEKRADLGLGMSGEAKSSAVDDIFTNHLADASLLNRTQTL